MQDAGSQVIALVLAAAAPAPGLRTLRSNLHESPERWLDMCAGPGGKASLLGALAAERGAFLLAHERAPHRAALVAKAMRNLTDNTAVVAGDGTRPAWPDESFDRVLVDAPCSGLGALRRRPESRWRRQPSDVAALVPLQKVLLSNAIAATKPGGVVAYATCSPLLAETVEVVESVMADHQDVQLEDAPALAPWLSEANCTSMWQALQLWPHVHGTDAMFLAVLRRRR